MDERLVLALWFGLGVGLQALLLIRGDWNWKRLAGCLGIGVLGTLPGRNEHQYEPFFHLLMCLGFFSCWFAMAFKDDILPVVSEKVLLFYSLIFWFAFFSYFYQGTTLHNILLGILLLPSVATVFMSFVRPQLSFFWKLYLYTWFLCTVISLGLIQFPYHHLSIFLSRQEIPWLTPLDCVVGGMAFLYLAVNIAYLYELIPIPERHQSWKDRMKKWHELTGLMMQRVAEDQPTIRQMLFLLLGLGGALVAMYFYRLMPSGLLINVLIVLPCVLSLGRNSVRLELERRRAEAERRGATLAAARAPGVHIGRNDLCPCGSGKKFKHCCGAPGAGTENAAR
jgi:hypothetical protein